MSRQTQRERAEFSEAALGVLRRLTGGLRLSGEEIAQLHEVHARHELLHGNTERARDALERARRARTAARS